MPGAQHSPISAAQENCSRLTRPKADGLLIDGLMEAVLHFVLALSRPSAAVTNVPDGTDEQFQSALRLFPALNGARHPTMARSLFEISGWGPPRHIYLILRLISLILIK